MRRLTATPVLIVVFLLCAAGAVLLGAQLGGVQSRSPTATPGPRVAPRTAAVGVGHCQVGHAVRRYVTSTLLTVANDPLSVPSGHTICLEAFTLPHARVSMTAFATTKNGTSDARGEVGFLFTAPPVSAPTKFVYVCHVAQRRAGQTVDLPASERFRVIP